MQAIGKITEFRVDTTEDLSQLNPDSLSRFDVLFLANATLRAPRTEGLPEEVNLTARGTFANYDLEMVLPDNVMAGSLALSSEAGALTGHMGFRIFPGRWPLRSVALNGDSLSLKLGWWPDRYQTGPCRA